MSILSNNKPQAHLGRTSHDLSSTHAFSMRPAVLRPVIVQDCVPDSAFRINASDLVRTTALQTAAFLRGKHELDFFFVPYNQIYSHFNDIVLERGDEKSPVFGVTPEEIPTFSLEHLYFIAAMPYVFFRFCTFINQHLNLFNDNYRNLIISVMSNYFDTQNDDFVQLFLNEMCYNINLDFHNYYEDFSFVGYDTLALLDTLGYGNFGSSVVSLCDKVENFYLGEYSPTDPSANDPSLVFMQEVDHLQYTIQLYFGNPDFTFGDGTTATKYVSLLRLFSFQKVFYDRYRDEVFDTDPLFRYAFSMDYDFTSTIHYNVFPSSENSNRYPLLTFLRSRTRMIKKDIVSGLFPTAQFGKTADMRDTDDMDLLNLPHSSDPVQAPNIRFALAMQKYRETLLRAGSRSKDVLKAMFGVESHYINDTYVRYLGSFSGALELNKVSATAESGTYSVGDLAGNVFSSVNGNQIEFTCNDYGCIIGVMSFFPELLHNNYGLSPHVLKSLPLHFFKSAFEDLGLQPVSSSIISICDYDEDDILPTSGDKTLGFSARYNEYKTNLDFAHDQFGRNFLYFETPFGRVNDADGFNSNYVVARSTYEDLSVNSTRNYLLPDCMDSIFAALDTGDITNYHFDVILDVQINAVLPMSDLGLPY